jgi:hypothetical protein
VLVAVVLYDFNVGWPLASTHAPAEKLEVVSEDIGEFSPLRGSGTGFGLEVYTLWLHCIPPVSEQPPTEKLGALMLLPFPVNEIAFEAVLFDAIPQDGEFTLGLP